MSDILHTHSSYQGLAVAKYSDRYTLFAIFCKRSCAPLDTRLNRNIQMQNHNKNAQHQPIGWYWAIFLCGMLSQKSIAFVHSDFTAQFVSLYSYFQFPVIV